MFNVDIRRNVRIRFRRFTDYFKGFEKVEAVRSVFGGETEKVLANLKVEFISRRGYMGVSDEDGHLTVSARYLRTGNERDLYLDVIHELVHVKQYMMGLPLHDRRWGYTDRPTEIEAYAYTVKEARRLGMTDPEIFEYLKTEWMTEDEVRKLARSINVNPSP